MGKVAAAKINQNASSQRTKAEELYNLASDIKSQMDQVDAQLTNLVRAGVQGSAIQQAAQTYLKNRKVIDGFVKRFAATALVLDSGAEAMEKLNTKAEDNATAK